jgi:secondary thiamine-phosphate synthase enzyme
MKLHTKEITIQTKNKFQIIDITAQIQSFISKNKIQKGIATIFTNHTTSAIIINENEPRLLQDIENNLEEIFPENKKYLHNIHDNNASSHLKSILMSPSQTIPIINNELNLGTWQRVMFVELDGPRQRAVNLSLIGE